jgi:MFS family permease
MASLGVPSSSIFRHKDFARFQGGRFLSTLAVNAQAVTIGWQVYSLARQTHTVAESAFLVGMVGLVQFVPLFLFTLVAGATADRHDRRKLVMLALLGDFLIVSGMAIVSVVPNPSLVPLFVLAALFGCVRAFLAPASTAMGPMLVPRDELPRAVAWNSMSSQSAIIIGPFLAGLLITHSAALAFAGSAAAYVAAAVLVFTIRSNTRPEAHAGSRIAQVREGLAYVWGNKLVLGAISLDLFAVLLGGATALLPVFAKDILAVGPVGFGVLRAGPAIGAVLVALTLSRWPLTRRAGAWMFGGVAVYGLATIVFAVSRWLPLSVLALAALGAGDMLSVYVRQSLVQIVTPDHMRGRVSAVSFLFIGASNELGEFETGVVARLLGPVGAALFGGFGSLVVTGLWTQLFPSLRKADSLTRPEG